VFASDGMPACVIGGGVSMTIGLGLSLSLQTCRCQAGNRQLLLLRPAVRAAGMHDAFAAKKEKDLCVCVVCVRWGPIATR